MHYANQLSFVVLLAFSQIIISCGQNVQTPEYSPVPGSSNKGLSKDLAGNTSTGTKTQGSGGSNPQPSGGKPSIESSFSGQKAPAIQSPQASASNSPSIQSTFDSINKAIAAIPKNSSTSSNKTPDYSSTFKSGTYIDPSIAYNSGIDLGINLPSSSTFADYSSTFNNPQFSVDPSFTYGSNLDFGFNSAGSSSSASSGTTTSSGSGCRTPTRAAIILNNC